MITPRAFLSTAAVTVLVGAGAAGGALAAPPAGAPAPRVVCAQPDRYALPAADPVRDDHRSVTVVAV